MMHLTPPPLTPPPSPLSPPPENRGTEEEIGGTEPDYSLHGVIEYVTNTVRIAVGNQIKR